MDVLRAADVYTRCFFRGTHNLEQGKGRVHDWQPQVSIPREYLLGKAYWPLDVHHTRSLSLGLKLQDKQIGFSQKDSACVPDCCLCAAPGGVVASRGQFLRLLQRCGTREHKSHWPSEPGNQGASLDPTTKTRAPDICTSSCLGDTCSLESGSRRALST